MASPKSTNKIQVEFPIQYFEGNLIITQEREAWAIYEIASFNYNDHISDQRKIDRLLSITSFLSIIGNKFHILWLPEVHDIRSHHEQLLKRMKGPLKDWGTQFIKNHEQYLLDIYDSGVNTNNVKYKAYIAIFLPKGDNHDLVDQVENVMVEVKKIWHHPKRLFEMISGINEPEIYEYEFQDYLRRESQIYERISRKIKLKRGDETTTEWLLKRNFWWGIADPDLRSTKTRQWKPDKRKGLRNGLQTMLYDPRQVLTLTEGEMDTLHPRRITITQPHDGEEKNIYHTYLTISDLADSKDIPGQEWLYQATFLPFPVEMSVKVEVLEHKEALKRLGKKRLEIDNQISNIREANANVPKDLDDKATDAHYLEGEYTQRKNPTFLTHVTFGIHHTDPHVLRSNAKILQDHFKDIGNIQVVQPAGDQWLLFNDFIPGSPRYVSDYIHRIPPETLAAAMIGATQELGDDKGIYIGSTGSRPVFLDPGLPSQINRSPSITFTGTLGGGKSVGSNLISYIVAMLGGKVLIFDPKDERTDWPEHLTELSDIGELQVVTLSSSVEDVGKLDPFIMLKDLESAKEAAVEVLTYYASAGADSIEYSYISRAVKRVADRPEPRLYKCIDELYEIGKETVGTKTREEAHLSAEILDSYRELSFAKLLFGDVDIEPKTISLDCAINILQIQELTLPEPDTPKDNYSLNEKMSIGVMFIISRFANQFLLQDKSYFKLSTFEEAWSFLNTSGGKTIGNKNVRTGRSLNGGAAFVTQNPTDLPSDLASNIGVKFAFRDNDIGKIKSTLSYYGLEHTPENIDTIRNLENGQCLMQDIYGRIGVMIFDVVFEHLFECFDTRPKEKREPEAPTDEMEILEKFQAFHDSEMAIEGDAS